MGRSRGPRTWSPFSVFSTTVLAIDCALVEALEQFRRGESKTPWSKGGEFFQSFLTQTSLGKYFTPETAKLFYKTIRCGILHQAEEWASQELPQLRGRMGGYLFLFSIIRYFYGNGRSLFDRQALRAALVLLFAAVVSLLLLRILEEFCLAGQLHA